MGLKMHKDGGITRKAWYAQFKDGRRWKEIKLTTPMRGEKIPHRLSDKGDEAFERSRMLAQAEFDRFQREREVKGTVEHLTKALIESKTGRKMDMVQVDGIEAEWRKLHPRKRCESQEANISLYFRIFAQAMKDDGVRYAYEVDPGHVSRFLTFIKNRYAWTTILRIMRLLKGAMDDFLPVGTINPFRKVEVAKEHGSEGVIHRKPITESELASLLEAARKDPLLDYLATTAACTGMRIGDICLLKWTSVDLAEGMLSVVTAKTGQEAYIPILPPLRKILEATLADGDADEPYVNPRAAQIYKANSGRIYYLGKMLFAKTLFGDRKIDLESECDHVPPQMTESEIIDAIGNAGYQPSKTERCIKAYTLYASGKTYRQVQHDTGMSRGQISMYFAEIEKLTGQKIIRWSKMKAEDTRRALVEKTRQSRNAGNAASLYGWHSLRATFVVIALSNGIPIEVVRRIVGHSTVAMTEQYYNPTKKIMLDIYRQRLSGLSIGYAGIGSGKSQITEEPDISELAKRLSTLSREERERLKAML